MPAQNRLSPEEASALLAWYAEAGVDEAVQDEALNRLAPRSEPASAPAAGSAIAHEEAGAARDPAVAARSAASGAATLEELEEMVSRFEGCALKRTAKSLCFADGNPQARLMLIGEAPGGEEDKQGKPFVGRAGRLLDLMLKAIGLDRTSAYIANVVYWRPPGNRTPTLQETQSCKPFIERQIELVDPDVLVFLGGSAAKEMLGRKEGILKLRGKWYEYKAGGRTIPAMATLHPAYLLRQPAQKKLAWRDMLAIRAKLDETA